MKNTTWIGLSVTVIISILLVSGFLITEHTYYCSSSGEVMECLRFSSSGLRCYPNLLDNKGYKDCSEWTKLNDFVNKTENKKSNIIPLSFGYQEVKTGEFIVQSQDGVDKYYDVTFESIKDSTDIKIKYCITDDKLIEAQKEFKDYLPKDITVKKTDSLVKSITEKTINLKSELTKESKPQNCIELIENPYLVDMIRLGLESTVIIPANEVFNNNIYMNITVESNFSHLEVIGDTSSPWRGFNYDASTRPLYPPYFAGDDNNSYYAGFGQTGANYVNVPNTNTLNFTGNFTISEWVYINSTTNYQCSIDKGATSSLPGYGIQYYTNNFRFVIANNSGAGGIFIASSGTIAINNWYHVVGVKNDTDISIYLNGVYINGNSVPSGSIASIYPFRIGGTNGGNSYFAGGIDNVLALNRSLNSTEVTSLYNLGRKDTTYTDDSLVSAWRFDNSSVTNSTGGYIAEDTIGINNGTFKGGVSYGYDNFGLVAYYPFDVQENVLLNKTYDYSMNNNDGTLSGGVAFNNSCIYGNCYIFDGSNDYVSLGTPASLTSIVYPYTISLWVKPNTLSQNSVIMDLNTADANSDLAFGLYTTSNYILIGKLSTQLGLGLGNLTANQWAHWIIVYNSSNNVSFYLNNVQQNLTNAANYWTVSGNYIGSRGGIGQYFNGSIDEVMIFNTALNSSQILDIYNNQSQRFKSQGTQTIKQQNITAGYNQINLTTQFNSYFGSNISARIGAWDVSLGYNNSDMNSTVNGLVSYWHFDEASWDGTSGEVVDAMGLNNGTAQNSTGRANTTSDGVYYRGGGFDGVSNFINGTVNNFMYKANNYSVSVWVNAYSATAGQIFANSIDANNRSNIYYSGASVVVGHYDGALYGSVSGVISLNTWYHVVFNHYSNGTNQLYLNGVTQSGSVSDSGPTSKFRIGYGVSYFNGSIDEVMIFNRSLSASEVKELYVKGRANWNYTDYQPLSTSGNIWNISSSTTNLLPDFFMGAGNSTSNAFYSPNLGSGDLNLEILYTLDATYPLFYNSLTNPNNGTDWVSLKSYEFNISINNTNGTSGIEFNNINYSLSNLSNVFNKTLIDLSGGTYNYFYWSYGNGSNHLFNISNTYSYTILPNSSYVLGISGTTPISYPIVTDVVGSNCPSQLTCNLDKSNIVYGVGESPVMFNYSTNGNANYTANSINKSIVINQGTPSLTLTSSSGWTISASTYSTIEGIGCPSQLSCLLYQSGTNVANPFTNIFPAGTYSFIFNTIGNMNYTSYSVSNVLNSTYTQNTFISCNTTSFSFFTTYNPFTSKLDYYAGSSIIGNLTLGNCVIQINKGLITNITC